MISRRNIRNAAIAIASAFVISGCVQNQPRPAQPIYDIVINKNTRDEQFNGDIGISIKPIMLERVRSMNNLYSSYQFWNPSSPSQRQVDKLLLVAPPVFEVQVTNTTPYSVSFQKTTVRLVDDAGNSYSAQLKQDILDFTNEYVSRGEANGWVMDRSAALAGARSLRMFDKNYESIPGVTEKRILSFDFGSPADVSRYLNMFKNTKYLRLILFNVPVKFDQAGNVLQVAKFEYMFDVVRRN